MKALLLVYGLMAYNGGEPHATLMPDIETCEERLAAARVFPSHGEFPRPAFAICVPNPHYEATARSVDMTGDGTVGVPDMVLYQNLYREAITQ